MDQQSRRNANKSSDQHTTTPRTHSRGRLSYPFQQISAAELQFPLATLMNASSETLFCASIQNLENILQTELNYSGQYLSWSDTLYSSELEDAVDAQIRCVTRSHAYFRVCNECIGDLRRERTELGTPGVETLTARARQRLKWIRSDEYGNLPACVWWKFECSWIPYRIRIDTF